MKSAATLRNDWLGASGRYVSFFLLCVLSTAISWRSVANTFAQALHNEQYTHVLLILPLAAALIVSGWRAAKTGTSRNQRAAAFLFAGAVLIAVASVWPVPPTADVQLAVRMLALVVVWIAAFVLCFGSAMARSLLFPLCFLFWVVPMPSFALARIVQWLQQGSAFVAWLFFSFANVPASRDGVVLSIPGLTVEVARECSSIRSSLMLLVTTMVLAHLLLRTPWRKTGAVILAIPLSLVKNGLRIFTIGMLGTRVDRSFLTGRLHHEGGILFFMLSLSMIVLLLWILRRSEGEFPAKQSLSLAESAALKAVERES